MIGALVLQIVLIFLNAVFASAEIAVISMNETKLKRLAAGGNPKAGKLASLTEQPARFLATIQVAITLAGLLGSAFAADNFAGPLVRLLVDAGVGIPESVLNTAAVILITLVLAYFNLVFGELVPKRIAMKKAESMALGMAGLLYSVSKLFAPLVWLLTASTNLILKLIGINPEEEDEVVTEEEIRMMLMEGSEQGTIQEEETEIIQNVFEFNDTPVEQICTHRREVVSLYLSDTPEKWEKTIQESRYTYYPVCGENQDDITGVLDTKDYFRSEDRSREYILDHAVDKAFFVPEGMRANVLFRRMKQMRAYFAVVIDEYGGMSGIITLHDLMEALVGELEEEETPLRPADIEKIEDSLWRIQGRTELEEVGERLGVSLPIDQYDTFSGFICGAVGRVPEDGEQFAFSACGLEIEVKDVKNHMVEAAMVRFRDQAEE